MTEIGSEKFLELDVFIKISNGSSLVIRIALKNCRLIETQRKFSFFFYFSRTICFEISLFTFSNLILCGLSIFYKSSLFKISFHSTETHIHLNSFSSLFNSFLSLLLTIPSAVLLAFMTFYTFFITIVIMEMEMRMVFIWREFIATTCFL